MGDADFSVQPRPRVVDGAVSVHDLVIRDLRRAFPDAVGLAAAVAAVEERKAFGLEKYGVVLHVDNGRDYAKDVDDELTDLLAYLRALLERHPRLSPAVSEDYQVALRLLLRWRAMLPALSALEAKLRV